MREIWVISDTHFYHENIIQYSSRPFRNAREMNEALRENWNSVIKPGDRVYHLGDVYMGAERSEDVRAFLSSLNGKKNLILGNHDDGKDPILNSVFRKIVMWRMMPEFGLLLTHVPVHPNSLIRPRKNNAKLFNVHGHTHTEPDEGPDYRNVSVERTNYRPVNIDTLRQRANMVASGANSQKKTG